MQKRVEEAKLQPWTGASGVLEQIAVAKTRGRSEIATRAMCQMAVKRICCTCTRKKVKDVVRLNSNRNCVTIQPSARFMSFCWFLLKVRPKLIAGSHRKFLSRAQLRLIGDL